MKRIFLVLAVLCVLLPKAFSQDNSDDVYYNGDDEQQYQNDQNYDEQNAEAPTYQTFYDQLSPYGTWVNSPEYGYIWVPANMGPDFSPYMTGGHWVYTEFGWTWVSDYAWGWGPYHYGRWYMDPFYGWAWVPGYDWAPAWVVWGDYGGYYCWAPVGPGEVLGPHYRPNPNYWYFVPHEHIGQQNIHNYVVNHTTIGGKDYGTINQRINFINHADTYNRSIFYSGPKPREVEKYTGHKVEHLQVTSVAKPGVTQVNGTKVNMYRPPIVRNQVQRAAPTRVEPNRNQPVQPNQNITQQRNIAQPRNQPVQQPRQDWTPPRQNVYRQNNIEQAQPQRRNEPVQPQQPRNFDRGFVPMQRSEPVQRQQNFSPPVQHFAPSPAPSRPAPSFSPPRGGGPRH